MCESDWKGGFIGTAFYFSWCLTLLVVPRYADKVGRKWLFLVSRLVECGLFLGTLVTRNYWIMVSLLACLGVAAAGRLNVGTVYMTEWFPRKNQTAVHIVNQSGLTLVLLSYVIFYWLINNETRYVSSLGYTICILTTILAFFIPESPRFLVAKGRASDVKNAFNRMAWFNRKKSFELSD